AAAGPAGGFRTAATGCPAAGHKASAARRAGPGRASVGNSEDSVDGAPNSHELLIGPEGDVVQPVSYEGRGQKVVGHIRSHNGRADCNRSTIVRSIAEHEYA